MAKARSTPKGDADKYREELDEYQEEIWGHRFESEAFVRAYEWARVQRKNTVKASLVFADAHELSFINSTEPVKPDDGATS